MKRLKIHICILLSTVFLFLPGLVAAAVHYVPTNDEFVVSGVTVNIGDILRIPILPPNAPNANSFSVQVILTPSPLPGGEAITLELTTLRGVGSAVFDNGSQSGSATISISQSTSAIVIRGVTNSSEEDNIMLSAKLHGSELASDVFTVRTWPIFNTFKLTGIECNPPNSCDNSSDGIMKAHYTMESESGKLSDINGNKIQEIVTFPILQICQLADAFCPSSPPYKDAPFTNPVDKKCTIGEKAGDSEHCFYKNDDFWDTHSPFDGFIKPYTDDIVEATQKYYFIDPVLDVIRPLIGPHTITREVWEYSPTLGIWKYRIEKHGYSVIYTLP